MTLMYELDLDIPNTYPHINNQFSMSRLSKVRVSQTDRQTDAFDRTHYEAAFASESNNITITITIEDLYSAPYKNGQVRGT